MMARGAKMKMLSLTVVFACFAINMMQADVRAVEIAQAQVSSSQMMVAFR